MKKTIYIIVILVILVGVAEGVHWFNKSKEIATYKSPDGNYVLIIQNGRGVFSSTMPGDGGRGSMPVNVILKDANGNIIGKSKSNSDCLIFYDSIYVTWDLENEQVWFGKAKTINLKTGKAEC